MCRSEVNTVLSGFPIDICRWSKIYISFTLSAIPSHAIQVWSLREFVRITPSVVEAFQVITHWANRGSWLSYFLSIWWKSHLGFRWPKCCLWAVLAVFALCTHKPYWPPVLTLCTHKLYWPPVLTLCTHKLTGPLYSPSVLTSYTGPLYSPSVLTSYTGPQYSPAVHRVVGRQRSKSNM